MKAITCDSLCNYLGIRQKLNRLICRGRLTVCILSSVAATLVAGVAFRCRHAQPQDGYAGKFIHRRKETV